ncbi:MULTISPECIES: cytochrome P450 [Streptomyces]|uniref:Cytochrome P450 n=1 Tax=Streptomyces doudnae TaxID=3075536 RepID=A0ABD5EQZ6_9ACTN|nr:MULTISPECIES: cytochrome P450 [unclassified Streptomyces]MDT0436265.1 cytochrome P450 [Streptomyces sp. DSM 41981]MYQ68732.1 cytochrome P450 [Streptomyces sp. SID4950]SCE48566.1 Cytochrome P450 [Streptomyces sp. SolWspMP-5a-2]
MTTSSETEAGPAPEDKTFPYRRKCPFSAPPQYAAMTERDVSQVELRGSGLRIWAVTGYETIRRLLTDPRVSASRKHANFPFYFVAPPEYRTETSFIGYDGDAHVRTRRKAALTFTHRQVQRLRPRVEEIVDTHLDAMLALTPPVDMHRVFSLAVPMTVICELLGIPQDRHDFFIKHGTALLGGHSSTAERQAAILEVNAYISDLILAKRREPGEDLLSRAIADYEASGEEYTDRDLFNMVRLLMNGGHETTASQISLGTACLLEHPDQLELLRSDPALVKPAVEELIRFATIGDTAVPRVALADIEVGGTLIRKGDGILCLGLAANRDPEVFPDPDRLDITRGSRKHLGFGHGVHHCIGADLARLELEIVWSTLFQRIPTLRLAKPFDSIPRKEGAVIYSLWELPVAW